MKFCPVVPEICHGQVHVPWKERKEENNNNNNNNKKKKKEEEEEEEEETEQKQKVSKCCLGDLIISWLSVLLVEETRGS